MVFSFCFVLFFSVVVVVVVVVIVVVVAVAAADFPNGNSMKGLHGFSDL